jgi:predicted RNA-binding protein with PUA-like domain
MKYWLLKTEPSTYSWADLRRDGKTRWDGVRNFQARNHIRSMRPGDLALIYHSVSEKSVVGVARVISAPYPDPSAADEDWSVVDIEPAFDLKEPVSLARIKEEASLRDMVLLKQSRLSVQPVGKTDFDRVIALGGRVRR